MSDVSKSVIRSTLRLLEAVSYDDKTAEKYRVILWPIVSLLKALATELGV